MTLLGILTKGELNPNKKKRFRYVQSCKVNV